MTDKQDSIVEAGDAAWLRKRTCDDEVQKRYNRIADRLDAIRTTPADEVERVAIALRDELRRHCVSRGECYASVDNGPAPDGGWCAEVDGEFNVWLLAEAAIAALATVSGSGHGDAK